MEGGVVMSSMTIGSGLYQSYSHIASGKRINTAADDAAGLAIGQKLQRQENGLSVAANNAQFNFGRAWNRRFGCNERQFQSGRN